jgi:hypothetical protein
MRSRNRIHERIDDKFDKILGASEISEISGDLSGMCRAFPRLLTE